MAKRTHNTLNARTVRMLEPGEWISRPVSSNRGGGILQARALANGTITYYLRITTKGTRERIPLGAGIEYRDAVRAATELSTRYQNGERDLYGILKAEQAEEQRKREQAMAKDERTLGALLDAYVEQMEHDGKKSVRDVRRCLHLNVSKAWPKLWNMPAAQITTDDLLDVVGRLTSKGKNSEARRLRAYLRAAYSAAISARSDAAALPALRQLRITANPASDLAAINNSNIPRNRALSVAELRAYWRRIESMPGINGALLRFHLLTGGQRIKQLERATRADYDADMQALHLIDYKGKRDKPRIHMVPLLPEALDAMQAMQGNNYLFTATAGKSGATYHVVNKRLERVVADMLAAGELDQGAFTLGDLRRTVETRLSAAGINETLRGHLQSHGLGGVQTRHYDRHDYMQEKRNALATLHRIATGTGANVVPLYTRYKAP